MTEISAAPPGGMSLSTRIRLSAMMFLQYMLVAVWFVPLSAYLAKLNMTGTQMALILSSMAIGCVGSPLIGMFADRHFASERVLAFLNLATAVLLFFSAKVTAPTPVFILLLLTMLMYMPTWGLTSAIAMSHSPSEKFPQIRVFGSIGWVAAALFSLVAGLLFIDKSGPKPVGLKIDGTNIPLYCGAAVAALAGLHALILPHTPPPAKGQKASIVDALGLRSLVLMKDRYFAVVIIGSLLGTIPFSAHWSYGAAFLQDKGFKYLTATMNMGQFVEMFLMLLVPVSIAALGLRRTILIGLAAQVVRYGAYLLGDVADFTPLYFLAILVHGVIFGFFYVGGQIYVDRKAPKEMKAQAQGLIFLISFGVGLLLGNFINGATLQIGTGDGTKNYYAMWLLCTILSVLVFLIFLLFFRDPVADKAPAQGEAAQTAPGQAPAEQAAEAAGGGEQ
ncbi:MAG: MFS transporter [Planctomycetes bacterium]|nr:MFS transporter [Planctomycetota bacterium]